MDVPGDRVDGLAFGSPAVNHPVEGRQGILRLGVGEAFSGRQDTNLQQGAFDDL